LSRTEHIDRMTAPAATPPRPNGIPSSLVAARIPADTRATFLLDV